MARFIAVAELSQTAIEDLAGSRQRYEPVRRYLAGRGVRLDLAFRLDGAHHLLVMEAPESPTRLLNRALARAWPAAAERPGLARLVNAPRLPAAGASAGAARTTQVAS
jgi:hypothetical protein